MGLAAGHETGRNALKTYLRCKSRGVWRAWLREHHATLAEAWLLFPKKASGKAGVSYEASVEEAICFGWIDGLKKRVDADFYAHRFSPRKARSRWTERNVERAERMIATRRMTRAGRMAFEARTAYDRRVLEALAARELALSPENERALRRNPAAWKHFSALAPSYRKQYVAWLETAKKSETRARRLEEAIARLAENRKLGMK